MELIEERRQDWVELLRIARQSRRRLQMICLRGANHLHPVARAFHALKDPFRLGDDLCRHFNLLWVVQSLSKKYSASPSPQIIGYFRAVPTRQEGGSRVVTKRGMGCGGRGVRRRARWSQGEIKLVSGLRRARRTAYLAYGKTVWS
jgi:hypothetical protein